MRGRATALIVLSVAVMVALPALGQAQAQTFTRGVLGGTRPRTRGRPPPGRATPGGDHGRGARTLPAGGTAGLIQATPSGGTTGVFRNTAAAAKVPLMPGGFASTPMPALRAPFRRMRPWARSRRRLYPGRVSGSRDPRRSCTDSTSRPGCTWSTQLRPGRDHARPVGGIREETVGGFTPRSPEPSRRRAAHAPLQPNATAADMDARAKEIRTKLRGRRRPRSQSASDGPRVMAVPGRG